MSQQIAPVFYDAHRAIRNHEYTHFNLSGGRGSTKSSFVSQEVLLLIKRNPKAHALVMRKVSETLRDSVYAQYKWAIDQLGLTGEFRATVSPMEITYIQTGQKILFRGVDRPEKIKSIKLPFGYIAITHFEELDQFAGREEIRTILQSTMRGGDLFWNFETFNPPRSAANWANKDTLQQRPDRMLHKSCYTDVPQEWLGAQFVSEAELLREINEEAYRHDYLGEVTGTGGSVFTNIETRQITDDEINTMGAFYQGIDWGYYPDPFQWVKCSYNPASMTLYLLDEYRAWRQSNRDAYNAIMAKGIDPYDDIIADSAEPKSIGDFQEYGCARIRPATKGPGSVEYSVKWLQSLRHIVIDPARCPYSATEFLEYEHERTKAGEIVSGYPDHNNHAIDATRYALERIWRRRGQ